MAAGLVALAADIDLKRLQAVPTQGQAVSASLASNRFIGFFSRGIVITISRRSHEATVAAPGIEFN